MALPLLTQSSTPNNVFHYIKTLTCIQSSGMVKRVKFLEQLGFCTVFLAIGILFQQGYVPQCVAEQPISSYIDVTFLNDYLVLNLFCGRLGLLNCYPRQRIVTGIFFLPEITTKLLQNSLTCIPFFFLYIYRLILWNTCYAHLYSSPRW